MRVAGSKPPGDRRSPRRTPPTGRATRGVLACAAAMLAAAAALAQEPPVDLGDAARVAKGHQIFNASCAGYCHGRDGLQGKGPSLRNRADLTPQAVFRTIADGKRSAGKVMPPWRQSLGEENVWALTAYIMSLREAGQ